LSDIVDKIEVTRQTPPLSSTNLEDIMSVTFSSSSSSSSISFNVSNSNAAFILNALGVMVGEELQLEAGLSSKELLERILLVEAFSTVAPWVPVAGSIYTERPVGYLERALVELTEVALQGAEVYWM
jgi:hypothetical protein